ncbi:MAG: ankyrin repeat domain-containing protein [Gemmatimonadetes bacterium]|nr:ankyrin repeat domain-containing protein [Gemmatimonadota bacterium]
MTTHELHARIADGRTDLVWDFVAQGHPATFATGDGVHLIQWCAYYGDVSAVRFLLGEGETLSALGDDLGLNGAAFHGHWRLCEFLCEQGADVNTANANTGETPLHSALCTTQGVAHDLVVRVLLAFGADPTRATVPGIETGAFMRDCRTRGETALHRAAAFGSEQAIQLLLAAGASRDTQDAHGDTPLSWASWYVRPDAILRCLLHDGYSLHPARVPMREALLGRPHGSP